MAQFETWLEADLQKMIKPQMLTGTVFSADNMANLVGVKVYNGGAPATLGGSVSGKVIRADGTTVPVSGTFSGNAASIVLPQAAYAVVGPITISIAVTEGGATTTLACAVGVVTRTSTDATVDPGTIIPSIDALIAQINAAINSIPADYSALLAAIAPTFSASAAYPAGAYVWQGGTLYRFTAAHAAGSWTGTDATAAVVGSDVANLKSALKNGISTSDVFVQGRRRAPNAEIDESSTRCTFVDKLHLYPGDIIKVAASLDGMKFAVGSIDGYDSGWKTSDFTVNISAESTYYINVARTISTDAISPSDFDITVTIIYNSIYANKEIGSAIRYRGSLSSVDLNTIYDAGWYSVASAALLENSPEPSATGNRFIIVYSASATPSLSTWKMMTYYNRNTGVYAIRHYSGGNWNPWTVLANTDDLTDLQNKSLVFNWAVEDGTDLNTLYKSGWYSSGYAYQYTNSPEDDTVIGQRLIKIYTASDDPAANTWRVMEYYNDKTGVHGIRQFVSGAWNPWHVSFSKHPNIASGSDLDNITSSGWYKIPFSASVLNSPESGTGRRIVKVYQTDTAERVMEYYNYSTNVSAVRVFADAKWYPWIRDDAAQNTIMNEYAVSAQTSQGENVGDKIRVTSYNVAQYNNNSTTYISNERAFNFRKMLGKINSDFVVTQEDLRWIDANSEIESPSALYFPQYPYAVRHNAMGTTNGHSKNVVHSKQNYITSGNVLFSEYYNTFRNIEYATYQIGEKILLMCGTHTTWNDTGTGGDSAESIAARNAQFLEMFKWANGNITLKDSSGNNISAPTHTHCIICMDANVATSEDKANIVAAASANNFILANGGALGWIETVDNGNPADNIAVSDNIIINNVECMSDWDKRLYSDHFPFFADLTLLN